MGNKVPSSNSRARGAQLNRYAQRSMDRRGFFLGAAATLPVAASAQAPTLRDRVLGSWRIIDAETVNVTTGAKRPWLGRPRPYAGMIMYLPNGLMSVPNRRGAPSRKSRSRLWFAFCRGDSVICRDVVCLLWSLRGRRKKITSPALHRRDAAAFETGVTLVRNLRLDDGVLTLRTVDLLKGPEGETFNQLTWARYDSENR